MNTNYDDFENPLVTRYASREMVKLWSANTKFSTWRQLWIVLAEAEQQLGLDISTAQIDELKQHKGVIDFSLAAEYERKLRHDVMAHVHAYGDACPNARGIIHLGATSCYVTDNTDLILMRRGLELLARRLAGVIDQLALFAAQFRSLSCLGFTHLQSAQPTTVGKRACLWCYDLVMDLEEIERRILSLRARSIKGTTGTQASFLKLFGGDHDKVKQLESLVTRKLGFEQSYAVTGQTYSRKVDAQICDAISGLAQSAHKMATDLRILAHRKELEEPFEKDQIGSSAMAYKRNPMRSERICALSRFVISLQSSPAQTLATQWLERTLDDSANRRLVIPQAFLAADAILLLLSNVTRGLVVYPQVIAKNLNEELPFMATENIMMAAAHRGGDRQDLHERIRQHSHAAAAEIKQHGRSNDLLARIQADSAFAGLDFDELMNPQEFIGRAPEQVDEFIAEVIQPIRARYVGRTAETSELKV
jgi:adenylosuccinate lyase